jgi:hypothetical protein
MDQKEQIQLAFEIYERIARLESALWGLYYKEFLEIIMDQEDVKACQDNFLADDVF